MKTATLISPVDGSVYREFAMSTPGEVDAIVAAAKKAQTGWANLPLADRLSVCQKFVEAIQARKAELAEELTWQMGRPISYAPKEIDRMAERAHRMIELAETGLATIDHSDPSALKQIRRCPHGIALVIAPWNYPFLTAINTIIPALIAGNAVVLKPATQTALTGIRLAEAFAHAGLPKALFSSVLMSHETVAHLLRERTVDFVSFTGSVRGGEEIERAAAGKFLPISLELGGKDPAYVTNRIDLDFAAAELVDGSFFNSGQSCCAVERIYVHHGMYSDFVKRFVRLTQETQKLGNPTLLETTLGPIVTSKAADGIRAQINAALKSGARLTVGDATSTAGDNYMSATVLTDVNHRMAVMTEETFGPVVGIMPVASDEEAVALMNDSRYGLSASIWSSDRVLAQGIADRVKAGTVFINRCDYLDPSLAWTGIKDSGRGCSLSELGFHSVTRAASYYAR